MVSCQVQNVLQKPLQTRPPYRLCPSPQISIDIFGQPIQFDGTWWIFFGG